MRPRRLFACLTAAFGLLLTATAPAQAGEYTVKTCRPHHLCLYDADHEDGPNHFSFLTMGNVSDARLLATGVFNNGGQQTGADHIWFFGEYAFGVLRGCLHFHTGTGSPDKGTFADLTRIPDSWRGRWIVDATWGPECSGGRPVLQYDVFDGSNNREWHTVQWE